MAQERKTPKPEYLAIGERLIDLRTARGLNQKQAVLVLDIKDRTYQNYEYGFSKPNTENLKKIIDYYGCSYTWLLTGEGTSYPDQPDVQGPEVIKEPATLYGESPEEFVFIGHMRGEISGGPGIAPESAVDEMRVAFRRDWIKKKGDPGNMSIIKVKGDSMEPTLFSGDHVLVDHGKNFIQPQGGIYAISINNEIMIKRIQVLYPQGTLAVISDNKNYERLEMDAGQVHINGKVIWFCREIER